MQDEPSADEPFFHQPSASVRFWVPMTGEPSVAASVGASTLRYRFHLGASDVELVGLYVAHAPSLHDAVRRRLSAGSREPVMLRDADF